MMVMVVMICGVRDDNSTVLSNIYIYIYIYINRPVVLMPRNRDDDGDGDDDSWRA